MRSGRAPGANDPQQMRDNDKGQRRNIDREFHLHYWDCDDGTIELAKVVYHNDFFDSKAIMVQDISLFSFAYNMAGKIIEEGIL